MKIAKDHSATLEFALQTGKLLQNFGLVELTSYRWIATLSASSIAVDISREVPLAKRIEIVLKLIDRDSTLAPEKKSAAQALWRQVKDNGSCTCGAWPPLARNPSQLAHIRHWRILGHAVC